jgi:hypothetical protein
MELSAASGWTKAPVSWTTGMVGSSVSAFVMALTERVHASPKTSSSVTISASSSAAAVPRPAKEWSGFRQACEPRRRATQTSIQPAHMCTVPMASSSDTRPQREAWYM